MLPAHAMRLPLRSDASGAKKWRPSPDAEFGAFGSDPAITESNLARSTTVRHWSRHAHTGNQWIDFSVWNYSKTRTEAEYVVPTRGIAQTAAIVGAVGEWYHAQCKSYRGTTAAAARRFAWL